MWKSEFHGKIISFPKSFELIHQINREEKTLFGAIQPRNVSSLVLKITGDIAKQGLSNTAFYDAITERYDHIHLVNSIYTEK